MEPEAVADGIEAALAALATPERAEGERRYLKSELRHLGAGVPAVRTVVRQVAREHDGMTREPLLALVTALWDEPAGQPVHERRLAAVELLARCHDRLSVADADLLERLLREARTWALVDPLAIHVAGTLERRDPEGWDATVRRWATADDHWLRRASLLVHLPALRDGEGDFARFGALADGMLEEREFFVRKAIGWVLRDTGRRRPDVVADWLAPRAARAAGLTVREAVKHLPEPQRDRILAARGRA